MGVSPRKHGESTSSPETWVSGNAIQVKNLQKYSIWDEKHYDTVIKSRHPLCFLTPEAIFIHQRRSSSSHIYDVTVSMCFSIGIFGKQVNMLQRTLYHITNRMVMNVNVLRPSRAHWIGQMNRTDFVFVCCNRLQPSFYDA